MLSALSRGYSSWESGEVDLFCKPEHRVLPEVGPSEHHKHGVTVTPQSPGRGVHTAPAPPSSAHPKDNGSLDLPKTYLTRKGALLLFTAADGPPEKDHVRPRKQRKRKQQELIDLSLKLGTLERLSLSVLQYGDTNFDRETGSVTDKESKWFLKFLHQLSPPDVDDRAREAADPLTDRHAQPGGDLRVYLQDLKQRASSRGYGRENSLSSRARSSELREILQQLEDAWPTSSSQPIWQTPSSYTDASQFSTDEFLYPPRSPSISSESSRTLSRAKVLSSHKLTASLKSLNYLGRPASTDLGADTHSVTSPDIPLGLSHQHYTNRRSKSAYWKGTPTNVDLRTRPKSSHHATRVPSSGEGFAIDSFGGGDCDGVSVIEEETRTQLAEAGEGSEGRAISVQVISPTFDTSDLGDRLPTMDSVLEEGEGQDDLDRVSMSSSVQREEDITLPSDGEEVDDTDNKRDIWTSMREDAVDDNGATGEEDGLSATRPLEPQYTGVLQDESEMQAAVDDEETLHKSNKGSRPGSCSASRADQQPSTALAPSVLSSRTASRVGFVVEEEDEEEADQSALDELMQADDTGDQQQTVDNLLDQATRQLAQQEKYSSSTSGSVDRPEPDPETLVSLHPDDQESREDARSIGKATSEDVRSVGKAPSDDAKCVGKAESEISQAELQQRAAATPEPTVSAQTPEPSAVPDKAPSEISSADEKKSEKPASVVEEGIEEVTEGKALSVGESDSAAEVMRTGTPVAVAGEEKKAATSPALSPSPAVTAAPAGPTIDSDEAKRHLSANVSHKGTLEKKVAPKPPASPRKAAVTPRGRAPTKGVKKGATDKSYVKAMDITSVQPEKTDSENDAAKKKRSESPKKKESYRPPPPPAKVKVTEKQDLVIPDHMKDALERSNSLSQAELENELERMKQVVDESLSLTAIISEDAEGLTEEELREAEEALKARLEEAHRKMLEVHEPSSARPRSESPPKPKEKAEAKPKKGKKVKIDDKAEEKARKEAKKELQRQERLKRLEEAKALQALIADKEAQRKAREKETARKSKELEEQMDIVRQEEESIQQAEDDAREQLAALRKIQREEREARRKVDLEKKKQDAIAKREKEKAMMEKAKQKEQEMLNQIADGEMRRAVREEEDRKRDEEERLAQERFEEELRLAQQQAEEEEQRLQELERQAEEEAFVRIQREREEAERQREELEKQKHKMEEEEERQRQVMLEEERKLEEEQKKREADDEKKKEEEKQRLKELQRLEEEAREKMRAEVEKRRETLMKRRDVNLDRKKHLDGLKHSQGMTEPWTFSYYVMWPRETYRTPMGTGGGGNDKNKKPKPKK